jgi:hypothetical protein
MSRALNYPISGRGIFVWVWTGKIIVGIDRNKTVAPPLAFFSGQCLVPPDQRSLRSQFSDIRQGIIVRSRLLCCFLVPTGLGRWIHHMTLAPSGRPMAFSNTAARTVDP